MAYVYSVRKDFCFCIFTYIPRCIEIMFSDAFLSHPQ